MSCMDECMSVSFVQNKPSLIIFLKKKTSSSFLSLISLHSGAKYKHGNSNMSGQHGARFLLFAQLRLRSPWFRVINGALSLPNR